MQIKFDLRAETKKAICIDAKFYILNPSYKKLFYIEPKNGKEMPSISHDQFLDGYVCNLWVPKFWFKHLNEDFECGEISHKFMEQFKNALMGKLSRYPLHTVSKTLFGYLEEYNVYLPQQDISRNFERSFEGVDYTN